MHEKKIERITTEMGEELHSYKHARNVTDKSSKRLNGR